MEPLRIGVLGAARIAGLAIVGPARTTSDRLVAVAAGKHVLTEKPSASNAEEAREVRDAAARAQVTLLEGFHYLYHPVTRRLHQLLDSGELVDLRQVEAELVLPGPRRRRPPLVAGAGGRRADGPGLLQPARPPDARPLGRRAPPAGRGPRRRAGPPARPQGIGGTRRRVGHDSRILVLQP